MADGKLCLVFGNNGKQNQFVHLHPAEAHHHRQAQVRLPVLFVREAGGSAGHRGRRRRLHLGWRLGQDAPVCGGSVHAPVEPTAYDNSAGGGVPPTTGARFAAHPV
uniref:Uncharacterized protein n=1 Tax=Cacopsylla melanoneura TaxID=428564 RepID=A0A8D8Y9C9_9HEMI